MPSVLFHRQYDQYSGGQQKVLDYFDHCLAHPDLDPYISWGERSVQIENTPWQKHKDRTRELVPDEFDIMFLAGMDWQDYLGNSHGQKPVINLIQHVRHADPGSNVHPYLSEPATRICVSEEVKAAIDATGRVNGRTVAIPNGIDAGLLKSFSGFSKPASVYILGLKQPELADALAASLAGRFSVTCHTAHMAREQVLEAMAAAEIAVLLPHETEGFFLPALEAMCLSRLVIVPDCVGNRSFCKQGVNCLMPEMALEALSAAVMEAAELVQSGEARSFEQQATRTLDAHTLERERQAFHSLVDDLGII